MPVSNHIGLTDAQAAVSTGVDPALLHTGYQLIEKEKQQTFRSAWNAHWRAALWSAFLSTALWMEGFDTSIVNSFFGQPQFIERFGTDYNGEKSIPADWQGGLTNAVRVGEMLGLVVVGYAQERWGSRKTYIAGMVSMTLSVFLAVFAKDLPMLLGAEIVMGIPWGIFQTLSIAYSAEICPIGLRGYLTSYVALGWGAGRFLSTGVLNGTLKIPNDYAWKVPYMLQWIWPIPLGLVAFFAPESPWWLARKGRVDEARKVLVQVACKDYYAAGEVDAYIAVMQHTDALEKVEAAQGSWKEMFKGTNLRRTEIMCGIWAVQVWNGILLTNLTVQFLRNAGLSTEGAFNLNLVLNAMSILGICISWVLLPRVGRRWLYLGGLISEAIFLLPIGIIGFVHIGPTAARAVGAMMVLINLFEHFSIGPVCYTIAGELPASRLRAFSLMFGRVVYQINAIVGDQLNARMVAKNSWNLGAKAGFFHLGTNLLCFVWAFFRLPETGGFSFAELDILFANKVPARKFRRTIVHDEAAEDSSKGRDQEETVGAEKPAGEEVQTEDKEIATLRA